MTKLRFGYANLDKAVEELNAIYEENKMIQETHRKLNDQADEVDDAIEQVNELIDGLTIHQVLFIFGSLTADQAETKEELKEMIGIFISAATYCYEDDQLPTANDMPV